VTDKYEHNHGEHAAVVRQLLEQSRTATVPQLLAMVERRFKLKEHYRRLGLDGAAVNLDRLRDYARNRFSSDQALTLATFLEMLRRDIMNDAEARDVGQDEALGDGQVTVMTVHRSKGLEFPVVILPGIEVDRRKNRPPEFIVDKRLGLELNVDALGVRLSPSFQSTWRAAQKRLLAEEMRLFYVAVTRAQHMVCMFGVRQEDEETSAVSSWQTEVLLAMEAMKECDAMFFAVRPDLSLAQSPT
jgi:DNA helicase-2/ATP-dependent DNA helicase PcrA